MGEGMRKIYKRNKGKLQMGPGGIACPCCGWGAHPRTVKPLTRRFIRRKLKQELKKEQYDD